MGTGTKHLRLLILAALILGCDSGRAKSTSKPPLTIRVVDSRTQQPIAGAPVAYAVESYVTRPKMLGFIPRPDPTLGYRLTKKLRGTTDARGEVVFGVEDLRLPQYEEVVGELVFVNVRVDMGHAIARAKLDDFEQLCRTGSPLCPGGKPDDTDVIWAVVSDSDARRLVLHASQDGHGGLIVLVHPALVEPRRPQGSDEEVGVVDQLSPRDKPSVLLVALERSKIQTESSPRP